MKSCRSHAPFLFLATQCERSHRQTLSLSLWCSRLLYCIDHWTTVWPTHQLKNTQIEGVLSRTTSRSKPEKGRIQIHACTYLCALTKPRQNTRCFWFSSQIGCTQKHTCMDTQVSTRPSVTVIPYIPAVLCKPFSHHELRRTALFSALTH